MIENPWNKFLENFILKNENRIVKDIIVFKTDANIYLIQSIPNKFQKLKDLVLCNNCDIFVSKRGCLCHAKLHNISKKSQLPHNAFPLEDSLEISRRNNRDKQKVIDKSKFSKPSIVVNKTLNNSFNVVNQIDKSQEANSNFIPQSILDTSDPLKMKIRLQPTSNSEPKNHTNNGNIFENLHSFYQDINSNRSINVSRIATVDEFLNDNCNEKEKKECNHRLSNSKNLGKIRRIDLMEGDNRGTGTRPMATFSSRCQQIIPIRLQAAANVRPPSATSVSITPQFQFRSVVNPQSAAQSNDSVFQNTNGNSATNNNVNRVIRIRGQPKRVRIQKLSETAQNWQIMQSENSTPVYQNQEAATQRQFQRRLIQQGIISENDIVRCSRSGVEPDLLGSRRKFTIINGPLPRDSRLQVIGRVTPVTNHQAAGFIRAAGETRNHCHTNNPPTAANQRHLMYNRIVLARNNSVASLPQETVTHNPRSRRCLNASNVELSDEEFVLDSQYQDQHNGDLIDITSSSSAGGTSAVQPHTVQSHSYLSNVRQNKQHSDPEIITYSRNAAINHSNDTDGPNDPSIHFLPPPGSQITGLPWDS